MIAEPHLLPCCVDHTVSRGLTALVAAEPRSWCEIVARSANRPLSPSPTLHEYLASGAHGPLIPMSTSDLLRVQRWRAWGRRVVAHLGTRPVRAVTSADLTAFEVAVALERTPSEARKDRERLQLLVWQAQRAIGAAVTVPFPDDGRTVAPPSTLKVADYMAMLPFLDTERAAALAIGTAGSMQVRSIQALQGADLQNGGRAVWIAGWGTRRRTTSRQVRLPRWAEERLSAWLSKKTASTELIFSDEEGRPRPRVWFDRIVADGIRAIGLAPTTAHTWAGTISLLPERGSPPLPPGISDGSGTP